MGGFPGDDRGGQADLSRQQRQQRMISGGGFGGGIAQTDNLGISAEPEPPQPPGESLPGRTTVSETDKKTPAFGSWQLQFPGDGGFGESLNEGRRRAGAARLSIRAHVAQPEDYRSMKFRSIGATQNAGILQVVVQERSHLNAMRTIAGALIVLLCVWINSASLVRKLCFVVLCLLSAAAAVGAGAKRMAKCG